MPNVRQPRSGSMQYWPRKRAKRHYPRIRTGFSVKGISGFPGYKVGMTHVQAVETDKHSPLKGEEISIPVTILECPPMKIASVRLYKKDNKGLKVDNEIFFSNDKILSKKTNIPKKSNKTELDKLGPEEYAEVKVVVYTQPHLTSTGKKKPELFELFLAGSIEEKINFVKENKDKEILLQQILKEGDLVDIKAVTKGKGFQGPVKRFGISIRQAKSEKAIRNPGSLGPWKGQGHIMYRVPHAGKMGHHQRTEYNKQILKIIENPEEIIPKGGFVKYGKVKNTCALIKGSVAGPRKRVVVLNSASRPGKKKVVLPTITKINVDEKQGN